jgi:hypothetical protein
LAPRPRLDLLEAALPTLRHHFPTHRAYGDATAEDVIKSFGVPVRRLEAMSLASMVFLNRGNRFEAIALPTEAQLAPAFAVQVADFDGNGTEDLFLSQNFFALPRTMHRLDAGLGLILLGRGDGRFDALAPARSGVRVYGEQRGAAVSDFDADGRPDLAVSQNGAETCPPKLGRPTGIASTSVGNPRIRRALAPSSASWGASPGPARAVLGGRLLVS